MQDYYYELVVKVSSHKELFADFLSDIINIGFEESQDGFTIRSEDEVETIAWGLEQFCEALQKALGKSIELEYSQKKLKNSDWVGLYQKSITPIEVAGFYIRPTWEMEKPNLINIAIDPALAFGTGHHPTTASTLRAITKYVKKGDTIIDVGCGSGILSIAAIKLGAVVDACDTDRASVENSKVNAKINEVEFADIWEGSCFNSEKKYNIVVANIVADVLTSIAKDLKSVLESDGVLILSGILDKYENKVLSFYRDFKILETVAEDEWITLVLKRK